MCPHQRNIKTADLAGQVMRIGLESLYLKHALIEQGFETDSKEAAIYFGARSQSMLRKKGKVAELEPELTAVREVHKNARDASMSDLESKAANDVRVIDHSITLVKVSFQNRGEFSRRRRRYNAKFAT